MTLIFFLVAACCEQIQQRTADNLFYRQVIIMAFLFACFPSTVFQSRQKIKQEFALVVYLLRVPGAVCARLFLSTFCDAQGHRRSIC